MRNKLYVVGVGPGDRAQLTLAAREVIDSAGLVVAAKRHMELAGSTPVIEMKKFKEAFETIDSALNDRSVAVLVSGDTGVYSLMPLVKKRFPSDDLHVLPGISSLQMLCSEVGETWIDAKIISGHGRDISEAAVLDTADQNAKTIFFCGPDWAPQRVCRVLAAAGRDDLTVTVGEMLSYPEQRLDTGRPSELAGREYDSISLVLIRNPKPWKKPCTRPHDDEFIRTKVPMTRETVRSAIIDALRLDASSVVWDLGAGTGSVTVAAALISELGHVYAVEKNPEAVDLIRANCRKFHRHNVTVIQGDSSEKFSELPVPTHVFIGGSGGELADLLHRTAALGSGIRVVVSAVALRTYSVSAEVLSGNEYSNFEASTVAVSLSKKIGSTHIMAANNPVTIFSAVTAE